MNLRHEPEVLREIFRVEIMKTAIHQNAEFEIQAFWHSQPVKLTLHVLLLLTLLLFPLDDSFSFARPSSSIPVICNLSVTTIAVYDKLLSANCAIKSTFVYFSLLFALHTVPAGLQPTFQFPSNFCVFDSFITAYNCNFSFPRTAIKYARDVIRRK